MRLLMFAVLQCAILKLWAQPSAYYNSLDLQTSSSDLKAQLSSLMSSTHTEDLPYTSSNPDTWDAVRLTDEVLGNSSLVYLFYGYDNADGNSMSDYTRSKESSCHSSGCSGLWNREHVYAKSLAEPNLVTNEPGPGTDVHNLRACDGSMNSSKGNRLFQDDFGNAHITDDGEWYPGDEWKGDVARIIMYMYLRYPTQCSANATALSSNDNHTDMPDVFLEWNAEDPVSQVEYNRNNVLESIQGNRNPFIDNPYLATLIWGGEDAEDTWNLLSVEAHNPLTSFSLYPNPVSNEVSVKYQEGKCSRMQLSVMNLSGQNLLDIYNTETIDVSSFPSGMYLLQVQCENHYQTLKFNKM